MQDVVITAACRTAIGSFGGSLKDLNAAQLASAVMQEAIKRCGIDPALIDEVRMGCVFDPPDSCNVARTAWLMSGLPVQTTAATINRVCISGMEAVLSGAAMIQTGMADVVLAGGVEHMSGVAYSVPGARWGQRMQDQALVDDLIHGLHCGSFLAPLAADGPVNSEDPPYSHFVGKPYIMGQTAEFVAQYMDISRKDMDEMALMSNQRAQAATENGWFKDEIVPLKIPQGKKPAKLFDQDEHFRPGITLADLEKLKPAFAHPKIGKVTAGNSSGINDGAAALIIMSAAKASELGLKALARIKAVGRGGCHPSVMGLSPLPAVKQLMDKSGLYIKDFELVEINEAFAAQYLACERELGLNRDITNVHGSGIGLGHPVGATGARIMVTLLHALGQRDLQLGLATLCGGGGVAMACALERI
jgi:acetyl-CoA C-acetyltransferase